MIRKALDNYKNQQQASELPTLKAALFDMDGVIFDSMDYHAKSWVNAFKEVNIEFSEYEVYLNEGRTGASTIQNAFLAQKGRDASQTEIQALYAIKSRNFEGCGEPIPMGFAQETLLQAQALKLGIYLVTGSGQASLLNTLHTYFPSIFSKENMVTAYDVTHGKPHPEPYLMGLEKAKVLPLEAIVVENAPLGVQAAVAANLFTVAINTGILEDKILEDAGAHLILDSLESFYRLLPDLARAWK